MRRVKRPRRYVRSRWLTLLSPVFTYNYRRKAFVLRGIGQQLGPVLRVDRRVRREGPPDRIELRRRTRVA
jgi:hypothetical protein